MNNIIKFVHAGMPKTLTSALQQGFFCKHDELYYLGVGVGSPIDYIDDDINFIFEDLMLYARDDYYKRYREFAKETFQRHLEKAVSMQKKAIGVSLEWLSFNFSPDMIDSKLRINRLYEIMGPGVKVILFTRNQKELLKSLYNEYVKIGLPYSYYDFIEYINNFKDRNFYFDLFYDIQYKRYSHIFDIKNVNIIPIEKYRNLKDLHVCNKKICLIEDISDILSIKYQNNLNMAHVNQSLNSSELYYKLRLNYLYPHDFGNNIFRHSNIHRLTKYFERENLSISKNAFDDVRIKRLLLERSKQMTLNEEIEYDFTCNPKTINILYSLFVESNNRLIRDYRIDLPDQYVNME